MTDKYQAQVQASSAFNERNDCVVKMTSLALQIPYFKAHDLCKAAGRQDGHGMKNIQWKPMLEAAGLKLERVDIWKQIAKYPSPHNTLKNVTTHHPARFNKVWADGERYIMVVDHHVAYIENGTTHDWTEGRSMRAIMIYKIVEGETK